MKRKLLVSAVVMDVEQVQGVSFIKLVWPQKNKDGTLKVRQAKVPVIAFEFDEIDSAHGLLDKLLQVANFDIN